ncbi:MAG: hypothetical protein ACOZFS_13245 [Thermodesulfobacteriota bacterium]
MQAKGGIAWLVAVFSLLVTIYSPAMAAGDYPFRPLPVLSIEAPSSLETQMFGEKPLTPGGSHFPGLQAVPSLKLNPEGDAALALPRNLELNISIRYNREPSGAEPPRLGNSSLYMKYAVDYRVLSNLRVGLNSYLYRPSEDGFAFQRPLANQLLGVGPELKYDLGKWSFLVKSQLESGNRDQGKDLQNWFRVWYAF